MEEFQVEVTGQSVKKHCLRVGSLSWCPSFSKCLLSTWCLPVFLEESLHVVDCLTLCCLPKDSSDLE